MDILKCQYDHICFGTFVFIMRANFFITCGVVYVQPIPYPNNIVVKNIVSPWFCRDHKCYFDLGAAAAYQLGNTSSRTINEFKQP